MLRKGPCEYIPLFRCDQRQFCQAGLLNCKDMFQPIIEAANKGSHSLLSIELLIPSHTESNRCITHIKGERERIGAGSSGKQQLRLPCNNTIGIERIINAALKILEDERGLKQLRHPWKLSTRQQR